MTLRSIEVDGADLGGERGVAIRDLLEENDFRLISAPGPHALRLAMREGRIVFALGSAEFHLSLGPFRQVMKDYAQIRTAHAEGVKRLAPAQIEAIDMARRGIHNEGARLLQERLEGKATMNLDTARRLFTLICAMQK
ncbi:UPF0262 family protein [Falsirhodobacter halotolerans]|uniref:UPF0262 family protein n=1 Tax=Falsirhodobacter halotolerans TaxID=1146892 RepID=UPI001FD2FCC7|nr:UPF0262 family protein [Falsirhodobacter halotolerans]MCJ8139854.1 UPF0262 family protein [Falsirhodobacter halotolerans]